MKIIPLISRLLLGSVLTITAIEGHAQTVPSPAEFYFDEDRGTVQPIIAVRGEGDAMVERLAKTVERDPRATAPMLQLAGIAMKGGREELGRSLYTRAIAGLDRSNRLMRPARWNYGWDLYRAGDASGALEQWAPLADAGPIRGEWLPTTLAMALWKLDRKDEAVQWYAAAVRTHPNRWSSPSDIAALLPDWREEERTTLIEVQRAWAANPPSWP